MARKGKRVYQNAREISTRALHVCTTDIGLIAGSHHFVDLWARDSLFATFGAGKEQTQKTIWTFLQYQRDDGLVPFLIRRSRLDVGKYFGKHTYYSEPKPQFRSSQSAGLVPDGGLMTVIAAHEYIKASNDQNFLTQNYPALDKAMQWYVRSSGHGLIREWFLCEWADSVMKMGTTLYTNVLYWKALGDMSVLAQKMNHKKEADNWKKLQVHISEHLNKDLWNGYFFADWKNIFRHDYFSSLGNMLAIVFGLARDIQADAILTYAKESCWNGWILQENYPRYPIWRIPLHTILSGMADYHNRGCVWLQPGIVYAVALHIAGKHNEARLVLDKIAAKIIEYQDVFEIYESNGAPVRRFLYTSERSFAWSAGLFVWADHVLRMK